MSNLLKFASTLPEDEHAIQVDSVIDIDRMYSKEFSDYLQKSAVGNPLLREHNTLILAAEFLIHSFHSSMPYLPLTLCNHEGLVLLETGHKEKIGRVCYLSFCKKLSFLSNMKAGKHICTKLVGGQLLQEMDQNYIYVFAYPIFDGLGAFVGYLTGASSDDETFAQCEQAVALMAKLITNYCAVLDRQIAVRSAVMNTVGNCALIMEKDGTLLEFNEDFRNFLQKNGVCTEHVNLLHLVADQEHFLPFVVDRKKGAGNGLISEFKLQLANGGGLALCNITQCEPLLEAYGESRYFICFDILKYIAVSDEKKLGPSPMEGCFGHLISKSSAFNNILEECQYLARKKINILIQGESGTGKEVLSRAIHEASMISGPFVAMNCGAIAPSLLVSELFGYEEGAFTGASRAGKIGKLEFAHNGTLFLDEIGEMPLEAQVSLLTFLDHQIVVRVGGSKQRQVNVRIIAATNRNLAEEVHKGSFREDLYYRLNVLGVQLPALRDRKDDIPGICHNILEDLSRKHHTKATVLDPSCMWLLKQYDWPGNVRELKNVLELATALAPDEGVSLQLLQRVMERKCFQADGLTKSSQLSQQERIQLTLEKHAWKITAAAAELKMSRTTLYKKIEQFQLTRAAEL